MIANSVTIGSVRIMIVIVVANAQIAFARWTRPAPHIARTVCTSLVSRDITSPVGWSR